MSIGQPVKIDLFKLVYCNASGECVRMDVGCKDGGQPSKPDNGTECPPGKVSTWDWLGVINTWVCTGIVVFLTVK